MSLLEVHLGARLAYSRELDDDRLDVYELPDTRDSLWLMASRDGIEERCRLGVHVGEYELTERLFDVLDDWKNLEYRPHSYAQSTRLGRGDLWLTRETTAGALSLDLLESTVTGLSASVERLRCASSAEGSSPREIGDVGRGGFLPKEAVIDDASRALPRHGHARSWPWWLFENGAAHGLVGPDSRRWFVGRSKWPAPLLPGGGPAVVMGWLQHRYPPDCIDLTLSKNRMLAAGALGWVAFAVEDEATLERGFARRFTARIQDSLLDVVAGALPLAVKASEGPQRVMPHSWSGWQRPLCLTASTLSGEAEVSTYDLEHRKYERADNLTELWHAVVASPSSEKCVGQLIAAVGEWVEEWLRP